MILYPYNAPIILTDTIFQEYGGVTGVSTSAQRRAAYLGAEVQMSSFIGTFLLPTTVTGTYPYPIQNQPIMLDHTYVSRVDGVIILNENGSGVLDSSPGISLLWNDTWGYVHISPKDCYFSHGHNGAYHYQAQIAYTAGLPSGTSYNPLMLMALETLADILLKEITDPASLEGGAGDPAITSWMDLGHSETRKLGVASSLGGSPRALGAAKLVRSLIKTKRALRL